MNVSSVKNLNGETFSAVQDAYLTDVVSNNSANWNEISAYQANSGTFLTAHQDLSDYQTTADMVNYQTTAGMTAYQEAGDYLTTADSGSFLTGVPDTYLQNTDLSTEDGKVTAISGIPLSAGGDVPEGVMVESGLEYNAVNEISGYNGSAIAQYGAEKQFIVHDDTLVHVANSAQYALGVNLSAVAQLLGMDETVIFVTASYNNQLSAIHLSEPVSAFDRIRIYDSKSHIQDFWWDSDLNINSIMFEHNTSGNRWITYWNISTATTQDITYVSGWLTNVSLSVPISAGYQPIPVGAPYGRFVHPMKIVGIGRKQ